MKALRGVLAVFVLSGCPGKSMMDAGVDAGVTYSPVDTCDTLAAAKCELLGRCYAAFDRDAPDDCKSLQQSRCLAEYETLKGSFENNLVTIDPMRVASCEQRMKTSVCPPTFPPDYFNFSEHPFEDCGWTTGLLIGKVKSGDTCDNGVECAPGTLCVKPNGVCKGTCSSYSNENQPCAFGCGPGLRCEDFGTMDPNDDVCKAVKLLNEACASSAECSNELICNTTCQPRGKEGESCKFDPGRLSTCDPGLACDVVPYVKGAVGKCVRPKDDGEMCHFHWACKPGLVCADIDWSSFPGAEPSTGFCRHPGAADTNCAPTVYSVYVGDMCQAGTLCDLTQKKCTAIPKQGDNCSPSTQTCSGVNVYCKPSGADTGVCTGPASPGDRCAFAIDANNTVTIPCTSGFCDTSSTLTCRSPYKELDQVCASDGECKSNRCAVQQDRSMKCAMACN